MNKSLLQQETIHSVSNGTFGELLQGVGTNNEPFLITSPVAIYSKATFTFNPSLQGIEIKSPSKGKSQQLVNKTYEKYQLKVGGVISIETQFPIGKGLGSSSADLVAVAKALSLAYSLNWAPHDIEEIIRGIEPTDGVMYPGIVSYYYKQVKLNKFLGTIENAMIVGVDEGGEIDTVEYNQIPRNYDQEAKQTYDKLHLCAEQAIARNDISLMGKISTQSSILNQQFNPKKLLPDFLRISERLQLPGIIVAHSGTYIGFLLDRENVFFSQQCLELEKIISDFGHKSESFYIFNAEKDAAHFENEGYQI